MKQMSGTMDKPDEPGGIVQASVTSLGSLRDGPLQHCVAVINWNVLWLPMWLLLTSAGPNP